MERMTPVASEAEVLVYLLALLAVLMTVTVVVSLRAAYNAWLDRRWQAGEPARVAAMLRHPAGGRGNR